VNLAIIFASKNSSKERDYSIEVFHVKHESLLIRLGKYILMTLTYVKCDNFAVLK
jgi:hypothetical protein